MSSSKWKTDAATGQWHEADNWAPAEVPSEAATFGPSDRTSLTFAPKSKGKVGELVFGPEAPSFTFRFTEPDPATPTLTIGGRGVRNESPSTQSFVVMSSSSGYERAQLVFEGEANAGGANVSYYAGPATPQSAGGGVIGFNGTSCAGAASFVIRTGAGRPPEHSTVGGEVSFNDHASAGSSRFTVYGTTGTDGDTFGNAVFHNHAKADHAFFTNAGGTVSGGDGGNTQFYDHATADHGVFHNVGGTVPKANGGDVAFDSVATAGRGHFYNYAATAPGAYGGVTSFNNNAPSMPADKGATAGNSFIFNYGSSEGGQGGGGHTEFSGRYGSGNGGHAQIVNGGSAVAGASSSSAGHTVFSISVPQKGTVYRPTAGSATFLNLPGAVAEAPAGYTQFTVYTNTDTRAAQVAAQRAKGPTAGTATLINQGGTSKGAPGGYTSFGGTASADHATLIANGGSGGGEGGSIQFYDQADGGSARVQLLGNGMLDVSDSYREVVTVGSLELTGGVIKTQVGRYTTIVAVSGELALRSATTRFEFARSDGFKKGQSYKVLEARDLSDLSPDRFEGNAVDGGKPKFEIEGSVLRVSFGR